MTQELRADPEALAGAVRTADRQAGTTGTMARYVEDHLARPEAFAGALAGFRDDYVAALASVARGLARSAGRASRVADGFATCRSAYLAADGEAAHRLRLLEHDVLAGAAADIVGARAGGGEPAVGGTGGPGGRGGTAEAGGAADGGASPAGDLVDAALAAHGAATAVDAHLASLAGTAEDLVEYHRFLAGAR